MVVFSKLFLFATVALALPSFDDVVGKRAVGKRVVEKRQFAKVQSDLTVLSSSVSALSTALTSYKSGLAGAIPINSAVNALQSQISKTTTDAKASPVVTAAQAQTICDYFKNKLIPVIRGALNALVAKKGPLKAAGLGPTVNGQLTSLRSGSNALATALIQKAPAAKKSCASSASSVVISLFNSAISAFNAA